MKTFGDYDVWFSIRDADGRVKYIKRRLSASTARKVAWSVGTLEESERKGKRQAGWEGSASRSELAVSSCTVYKSLITTQVMYIYIGF